MLTKLYAFKNNFQLALSDEGKKEKIRISLATEKKYPFELPVILLTPAELEAERRKAFEAGAEQEASRTHCMEPCASFSDYLKTVEGEE